MSQYSKHAKFYPDNDPDRYKGKSIDIGQIISNIDTVNKLYLGCRNYLKRGFITNPCGSIKKRNVRNLIGVYDFEEVRTDNQMLKGILLYIYIDRYLYKFRIGRLTASDKNKLTGWKCFLYFRTLLSDFGVDLDKYAITEEEGKVAKSEIESPIVFANIKNKLVHHVHHLDYNQAWPSCLCEKYPEFTEAVKKSREYDKHVADVAIGYFQSNFVHYRYSHLSKVAINGLNKKIWELTQKLMLDNFEIVLYNTDGIYYYDKTDQNRRYHDENEGMELSQWRNDIEDVDFYAASNGQYYYKDKDGKITIKMRGLYSYEAIKARENWDCEEDFFKALETECFVEFNEEEGFIYEKQRED